MAFSYFESPTPIPPEPRLTGTETHLTARIAEATGYDPKDRYFTQAVAYAQRGEPGMLYGTSGMLTNDTSAASDRERMQAHFTMRKLGNVHHIAHLLGTPQASEMAAYDFYQDQHISPRAAMLFAGVGQFAIIGSLAEINQGQYGASEEPHRQLWIPLRDTLGRLPAYIRHTGPAQSLGKHGGSYLTQDWVLLPRLTLPHLVPQKATAAPAPATVIDLATYRARRRSA